ncbi:MAG: diacylglycerol kinase family protein [Alphaproteobacteria bacterium]
MTAGARGSADRRRLLVIHNPVAGRRRRQRFQAVLDLLERHGDELSLRATEAPGDAIRLARQIEAGDGDLVVAAGGDGTINEVINGLVAEGRPAPLPLAIVPLGTSNVLAAEIGLGRSPAVVERAIREGPVRRVSLGRITGAGVPMANGRSFILMAGVGIDAHAVADVDPGLKRRFAQGAYVWAGMRQALRSRRRRYEVEIDGVRHEAAWVVVAKARRYGGPFVIAARARLDDPRFEVCLFARGGVWAMARYGSALVLGRLARSPGFSSVLGRRVRIAASPSELGEEPVQCDGDHMARLPVEVEVVPEALDLVVPRDGPYG